MNCMHTFLDYAWRSERIPEMPPFPKKDEFGIQEKTIEWMSEEKQLNVIAHMPKEHRLIFLWLKYHYRRTAEACALHKCDYDEINQVFRIRRSISSRQLVDYTKTHHEHYIPCHPDFLKYMPELLRPTNTQITEVKKSTETTDAANTIESPFMFINPRARKEGKRYTNGALNNIVRNACKDAGEKHLSAYPFTKHSACSQFINEKGGTDSELQMLTDHARLDSIKKYRKIETSRKLELMKRKPLKDNVLQIKPVLNQSVTTA